ncbi:MAG: 3-hydroxyacyl-ACP dehydratase FabZ [Spirochaetaceae bacterium]|nr:3-hydroxyacyl-ACP dehydratase FabZ [Spirochaetaceae bacterium]
MTDIINLIPHRQPFLFVDRLISVNEKEIVGEKLFSADEPFFAGHFPQYPVVPGVILVEALAQCGGAGVREAGLIKDDDLFFLASVEKAKFRRQVRPGELARFEVTNLRAGGPMLKQEGKVFIGDELACEASWLCLVGKAQS